MIILDTDALTIIQNQQGSAFDALNQRLKHAALTQLVCVTVISVEEQFRGWTAKIAQAKSAEELERAYRGLRRLVNDFHSQNLLDFDADAIAAFQAFRKKKVRIGTMDLRIAAIATVRQAKVISRNLRDFQKVPGLHVEDWTKTP